MKLTVRLNKGIKKIKLANAIWRNKGKFKDPPLRIPPAIQKLGVEIIDPLEEMKPKKEAFIPPEGDVRFWEPPHGTSHPLWKEQPALTYIYNTRFIEKTKQVCVLTKSQKFEGLPPSVSKLVGVVDVPNKEKRLQEFIMHAHEWNNTNIKLPKRFDLENLRFKFPREYGIPKGKSANILLDDLTRFCLSTAAQFPNAIKERRLIVKPYLRSFFSYKGENILCTNTSEYLLGANKDLQPFVDQSGVDDSTQYDIPDLFPVNPTIDFVKEHIYVDTIDTGFKSPYAFSKPHTILMINDDYWKEEDRQCRALMYCFFRALTRAREKYGEQTLHLPEPISVQCVNMSDTTLNFTCFQLNTLDIDNDRGIKNFVWFDSGNQLFKKLLPQPWKKVEDPIYLERRYKDFNPEPFDKMLALILNGLPVLNV